MRVRVAERGGLTVVADRAALDRLGLALGERRIAVRRLEQRVSPLESMFFALTGEHPVDSLGSEEHAERMLAAA